MRRRRRIDRARLEVARWWRARTAPARLGFGTLLVVLFWAADLGQLSVLGFDVPWPIGLLLAAMGWARVGLAMRPMATLVGLSFLFDLGANAPFGSYMLVALSTYGVHAAAEAALDLDYDPLLKTLLPFVSLCVGLLALWGLASVATGHIVQLTPLVISGGATALAYAALAPVFHLRGRPGAALGGA
ncbi:MAG: hypothetical protein AAGH87_05620 [Pseudomonadota bacterium]